MGAIGLYFGVSSIIEISILAFFVAAICSIILIFVRLLFKKKDEYIAFGPFLSIAAMACIFLPSSTILNTFLAFCEMISNNLF